MTSTLSQAFSQGFTSEQILSYLIRKSPKYAQKVSKALGLGFSHDQILSYISKNNPRERGATTEYEETRNLDEESRKKANKYGTGAALAGVAGVAGLSSMAGKGTQALTGELLGPEALGLPYHQKNIPFQQGLGLPSPESAGVEEQPPSPEGPIPMGFQRGPLKPEEEKPLTPKPFTPPQNPNIPITPTTQPALSPEEILTNLKLKDRVDNMLQAGNSPEAIKNVSWGLLSPKEKKQYEIEKRQGKVKDFKDVIEDYAKNPQKPQQISTSVEPEGAKLDETKETTKIAKSDVVATPEGVGEVKEIRNGKAIVDVDGKKHQVSEDELIQSPLPQKDLASLWDEMIKGVEEETGEEVSRNVEWAGYNPETNSLTYIPHLGDLYIYRNIEPERAELLKKFLSQRKTTGENFIGPWVAGSKSPIGAAMSKLIRELQAERGGKGNEYEEKFPTLYRAIEPAKKASKEKYSAEQKKLAAEKRKKKKL